MLSSGSDCAGLGRSHGNDALQPTTGGTVTVLFTDVVESTRLNQSLGDEQANVLRREIDSLCRAAVERNRGVEVKGPGDGMFLAFHSARGAVRCAQEIQRALVTRGQQASAQTVQLRIGLHTGEVITEAGDLHGETVVIAARLEAAAAGGEILVCSAVYQWPGTARSASSAGRALMSTASRGWPWPGASGARGRPTVRRIRRYRVSCLRSVPRGCTKSQR